MISLTCLTEESAEVIQEVMKVQRFGLYTKPPRGKDSKYPEDSTPFSRLQEEIGDWLGAFRYAQDQFDFDMDEIEKQADAKYRKLYALHGKPE